VKKQSRVFLFDTPCDLGDIKDDARLVVGEHDRDKAGVG
jgi:hypothetical protein